MRVGSPLGEPRFGKMQPCSDCTSDLFEQAHRRLVQVRFEQAGIVQDRSARLDEFSPEFQGEQEGVSAAQLAFDLLMKWSAQQGPTFVILTGPPGVGKSHLAEGVGADLCERSEQIRYVRWEDFADLARDPDGSSSYLRSLRGVDWLVVDDVGAAYDPRGYLRVKLAEVLTSRIDAGRRTLLTGNLSPEPGESVGHFWSAALGDRVADRMTDSTRAKSVSMWRCTSVRSRLGDVRGETSKTATNGLSGRKTDVT